MASVFNKTTNQYLESVNTPDYDPVDWIINPDVSALKNQNVPRQYWKAVESSPGVWEVVEFTTEEKEAIQAERDLKVLKQSGTVITAVFNYTSVAKNRWLNCSEGVPSNRVPFIVPVDGVVKVLTYANERNNADTILQVHRASRGQNFEEERELIHSETIYDIRTGVFKVDDFVVRAGDKIGVFFGENGIDPKEPVVVLYITAIVNEATDLEDNK